MERYFKKSMIKFNRKVKHIIKPEVGSLAFMKNNINLTDEGFSNHHMKRSSWVGPYIIAFLSKDRLNNIIGVGLVNEKFEPRIFRGSRNSIVSIRRIRLATLRKDGILLKKVSLPRVYKQNEWVNYSVLDKDRHKISAKISDITNTGTLKEGYYFIQKVLDSRFDNETNTFSFLVQWSNSEETSWVLEDDLLDKSLIQDFLMARYKLQKINKK